MGVFKSACWLFVVLLLTLLMVLTWGKGSITTERGCKIDLHETMRGGVASSRGTFSIILGRRHPPSSKNATGSSPRREELSSRTSKFSAADKSGVGGVGGVGGVVKVVVGLSVCQSGWMEQS